MGLLRVNALIFTSLLVQAHAATPGLLRAARSTSSGGHNTTLTAIDPFGSGTQYTVDITLGGQTFACLLDSASSDLWVIPDPDKPVKTVNTTDVEVGITYLSKNGVTGTVAFAELVFDQFVIPSQAFINPNLSESSTASDLGAECFLGLAFDTSSVVNNATTRAYGSDVTLGQTVLSNIIEQYPNISPNFDVYEERSQDLDEKGTEGRLIIGGHSHKYGDVTKQPVLELVTEGFWGIPFDGIQANGRNVSFNDSVTSTLRGTGKLAGVLDTGTSITILPKDIVTQIYSSVPGAFYDAVDITWILPCTQPVNVSFLISGFEYPISPLDASNPTQAVLYVDGTYQNVTVCTGNYAPLEYLTSSREYDAVLGNPFLGNVVSSYNVRHDPQATTANNGSFAQLLPLPYNASEAQSDFFTSRAALLANLPAEPSIRKLKAALGDPQTYDGTSASTNSSSNTQDVAAGNVAQNLASTDAGDESTSGSMSLLASRVQTYGPVVVGLLAAIMFVGVALAVILGILVYTRQSRSSAKVTRSMSSVYVPVQLKEQESVMYSESKYHD